MQLFLGKMWRTEQPHLPDAQNQELSEEAISALFTGGPALFEEQYGTHFVCKLMTGGCYAAAFTMECDSEENKKHLIASLSVLANTPKVSVEFSTQLKKTFEEIAKTTKTSISAKVRCLSVSQNSFFLRKQQCCFIFVEVIDIQFVRYCTIHCQADHLQLFNNPSSS